MAGIEKLQNDSNNAAEQVAAVEVSPLSPEAALDNLTQEVSPDIKEKREKVTQELAQSWHLQQVDDQFVLAMQRVHERVPPAVHERVVRIHAVCREAVIDLGMRIPGGPERDAALTRLSRQTGDVSAKIDNMMEKNHDMDDRIFQDPTVVTLRETLQRTTPKLAELLQPISSFASALETAGVDIHTIHEDQSEALKTTITTHLRARAAFILKAAPDGAAATDDMSIRFILSVTEAMHAACDSRENKMDDKTGLLVPSRGHLTMEQFADLWSDLMKDPEVSQLATGKVFAKFETQLGKYTNGEKGQNKYFADRAEAYRDMKQQQLENAANPYDSRIREYGDLASVLLYGGKEILPFALIFTFINNEFDIGKTLNDRVTWGIAAAATGVYYKFGGFDGDPALTEKTKKATTERLRDTLSPEVLTVMFTIDQDMLSNKDSQLGVWIDAAVREPDGFFPSYEEFTEKAKKDRADLSEAEYNKVAENSDNRRQLMSTLRRMRTNGISISSITRQ